MSSEKEFDPRMKQFWKHGLHPVTGRLMVADYYRAHGSGVLKTCNERPQIKNGLISKHD